MASVQRYRLTVRYDGTDFAGSQVQSARSRGEGRILLPPRTVSGTLKAGLEKILEAPVHLYWAGRTDSGVHAEANVCAFDAALPLPIGRLLILLNANLPSDIWLVEVGCAELDWHPRYQALSREYCYRLWIGQQVPYDVRRYVWHTPGEWDHESAVLAMNQLRGEHDFALFSRRTGVIPTVCKLHDASCEARGEEVRLTFKGNRFLWRMVRNLAGLIRAVARGKIGPEEIRPAFDLQERLKFTVAPAHGLVLKRVNYA